MPSAECHPFLIFSLILHIINDDVRRNLWNFDGSMFMHRLSFLAFNPFIFGYVYFWLFLYFFKKSYGTFCNAKGIFNMHPATLFNITFEV